MTVPQPILWQVACLTVTGLKPLVRKHLKYGLDIGILDVKMDENYYLTQSGLSTELTVVNIYAPNNERYRIQFFKRIKFFINN